MPDGDFRQTKRRIFCLFCQRKRASLAKINNLRTTFLLKFVRRFFGKMRKKPISKHFFRSFVSKNRFVEQIIHVSGEKRDHAAVDDLGAVAEGLAHLSCPMFRIDQ